VPGSLACVRAARARVCVCQMAFEFFFISFITSGRRRRLDFGSRTTLKPVERNRKRKKENKRSKPSRFNAIIKTIFRDLSRLPPPPLRVFYPGIHPLASARINQSTTATMTPTLIRGAPSGPLTQCAGGYQGHGLRPKHSPCTRLHCVRVCVHIAHNNMVSVCRVGACVREKTTV